MSESMHTPGPWELLKDGRSIFGKGPVASLVCMVHLPPRPLNGKDPWEMQFPANARLIAAAPELLEALKYLVRNISDARIKSEAIYGGTFTPDTEEAIKAIAKAEGKQ